MLRVLQEFHRKLSNLFKSSLTTTGTRISDDPWLVENTLPYVIPYLSPKDLLNASKTNALWETIIREYYFDKVFIPVCLIHKDKVVKEFGSKIRRLQLIEGYSHSKQVITISRRCGVVKFVENIDHQSNEFLKELTELTHLRIYSKFFNYTDICWTFLLNFKHLTYLELRIKWDIIDAGSKVLKQLINLEVLKLTNNTSDEELFEVVSNLKRIKEFEIIKTNVNSDLIDYLPYFKSLETFTIEINEPSDTNYLLLMKTIIKSSTLKEFCWILKDDDAFFGQNCRRFFQLTDSDPIDKHVVECSLSKHNSHTKVRVILESMYNLTVGKRHKECFECSFQYILDCILTCPDDMVMRPCNLR